MWECRKQIVSFYRVHNNRGFENTLIIKKKSNDVLEVRKRCLRTCWISFASPQGIHIPRLKKTSQNLRDTKNAEMSYFESIILTLNLKNYLLLLIIVVVVEVFVYLRSLNLRCFSQVIMVIYAAPIRSLDTRTIKSNSHFENYCKIKFSFRKLL